MHGRGFLSWFGVASRVLQFLKKYSFLSRNQRELAGSIVVLEKKIVIDALFAFVAAASDRFFKVSGDLKAFCAGGDLFLAVL